MDDHRRVYLATKLARRWRRESGASSGSRRSHQTRMAGEVRFVTDDQGPGQRDIPDDFEYDESHLKTLSRIVWGLSCSLGHLVSSHSKFTKLRSIQISPDGQLGGRGYVQDIQAMRTDLSESIETISDIIDTLHDEVEAPHWQDEKEELDESTQEEVEEMVEESEEIISDPKQFAQEEFDEEMNQAEPDGGQENAS